jgi:hypothetical protein
VHIALATTGTNLTLGATHHCVICTAPVTLTLPKCGAATRGRVYVAKATAGNCTVTGALGDTVSGAATLAVASGASVTLVSDGVSAWHLIGSSA